MVVTVRYAGANAPYGCIIVRNCIQVLICQGRSCRKCGSAQVLALAESSSLSGVTIVPSGCLGKCGNGPMVLVLPQEIWYFRVDGEEIKTIINSLII